MWRTRQETIPEEWKETVAVQHQQVRPHRPHNYREPTNRPGGSKSGRQEVKQEEKTRERSRMDTEDRGNDQPRRRKYELPHVYDDVTLPGRLSPHVEETILAKVSIMNKTVWIR